jgi:mRNA-degrading endonuclease HigB of HigAB toxin-antitoxin module
MKIYRLFFVFYGHIVVLPIHFYGENMATNNKSLDTLNLVTSTKPLHQPPVVQRRNKLIAKLWEQEQLVKAKLNNTAFAVKKHKTIKDLEGNRRRIEVNKRLKPWWFQDIDGQLCFSVRYGAKQLEIKPGKSTIAVKDFDELLTTLALIKSAVAKGSLDAAIDQASGALKANFKK